MTTHASPYGANRKLHIAGTDIPAVEGVKGRDGKPAFNQMPTASGEREINASSKKDLMNQISAALSDARSRGGLRMVADETEAQNQERGARFAAAYKDKNIQNFEVIGEVISDTIWETLN